MVMHGDNALVLVVENLLFPPIEGFTGDCAGRESARLLILAVSAANRRGRVVAIGQHQEQDVPRLVGVGRLG